MQVHLSNTITQIVAIGGVFVFLPAYLAILVLVIVLPVFVYVLLDVPPLPVFDPIVQLCMADIAILVSVNAVHNFPMGRDGVRVMDKVDWNQLLPLCFWKQNPKVWPTHIPTEIISTVQNKNLNNILTHQVQHDSVRSSNFLWLLLKQFVAAVYVLERICPGPVKPTLICLCSPQESAGQRSWPLPCPGRLHGHTGSCEHRCGCDHSDQHGDGLASPEQVQHRQQQPGCRGILVTSAASQLTGGGCGGDRNNGRRRENWKNKGKYCGVAQRHKCRDTENTNCSVYNSI